MATKATGAIITTIVILAVVVAVVFFLGKRKAGAAPAGVGAPPPPKPTGSLPFDVKAMADFITTKPVKSAGVIPPSGVGLPPPACPEGVDCESDGAPGPTFTPPPRVFKTQADHERYLKSAF